MEKCKYCGRPTAEEDNICEGCKNKDGYRGNDEEYEEE